MKGELSLRLGTVFGALERCECLIDVGTDHGLLPVAAVKTGVAQRAIAADLRPRPLEGARRTIAAAGMDDRVTRLLSDGLAALEESALRPPVDALSIAGMSGDTMVRICDGAPTVVASLTQIVVQPNSGIDVFRRWAFAKCWHLRQEQLLVENGRYFQVLAFVPGSGDDPAYAHAAFSREELFQLGPKLLRPEALHAAWFAAQVARVGALVAQGVAGFATEYALWERALRASSPLR
jgi:tRNA (adenine22-N1)-methyltransferase